MRVGWCSAKESCTFMSNSVRLSRNLLRQFMSFRDRAYPAALIPASSLAGNALTWLIAIMTFLSALSIGAALLVSDASRSWKGEIAEEMTIQVKPAAGRDIDADVQAAAELAGKTLGVQSVRIYSRNESAKILEPWLGAGLELGDLPVPRLIVLKKQKDKEVDKSALISALKSGVPTAALDDHRLWSGRLTTMALSIEFVGFIIVSLILAAMVISIFFSVRASIAGAQHIVDVLHFVGAEDRFIAYEFEQHFRRLGVRGGILGGAGAVTTFLVGHMIVRYWASGTSEGQLEAMFGSFSIRWIDVFVLFILTVVIGYMTGVISRLIVTGHLKRFY
jgi:cell division transport system permease protein